MSSRFDPQAPDKSSAREGGNLSEGAAHLSSERDPQTGAPTNIDLLAVIGRAEQISKDYHSRTVEKPLNRAYRAWQNEHAQESKYLGPAFRGRSRIFVPKTRAAVRKNLATAAASLFSTEDVVNVTATYEDDNQQRATAAAIKANLEYRLTQASAKSGIPWYIISMGACLDSQLTGVSVSKQSWEYIEVPTGKFQVVDEPILDEETGTPMLDGEGFPILRRMQKEIMRVVRDRPMIELHPIEHIGVDPAAPWHSPVQGGRWFFCRYPMGFSDCKAMLAGGGKNGDGAIWLEVPDELLLRGRQDDERTGPRRSREGGGDRYEEGKAPGHLDIVWIQENFIRIAGKDYHFWSVGRHGFISKVQETHVSYPANGGERPYVMGVAQLDSHRVFPQSPVETWQPLQLEINDVANLRLDTLKRSIAPLTVVRRGKNVDMAAVLKRGQPEAIVTVDNLDDVMFQQTPGPSGSSYTETSVNNALFDELSGTFSTSSVQSSRQLNETVGGMRMMSGAANAVSEFDLRMWIETWVEPVLRQVVQLIRHYESDERILALSGQRARVWTRYEYMPNLDDFEQAELTLRVNAGIGALDPLQKLQKLKMAIEMLAPILPMSKNKQIALDVEALIEEVMGAAGFRDGRRFFTIDEAPQQNMPPPEVLKVMEEIKLRREEMEREFEATMAKIQADLRMNTEDNNTRFDIEGLRTKREILKTVMGATERHNTMQQQRMAAVEDRDTAMAERARESQGNRQQRIMEMLAGTASRQRAA